MGSLQFFLGGGTTLLPKSQIRAQKALQVVYLYLVFTDKVICRNGSHKRQI